MTLTPPCDTPGCNRPSVHVMPYEKILGKIRKAHRKCPGCYIETTRRRERFKTQERRKP